jgi:hypothetical protein
MIQAMVWELVFTSGAGNVLLGADEDADLGREAAGQALDFAQAELLGVDDDAALAAAERDADDGAFPGHPHRQSLDLVEGHVLVVADAALGRAAAEVVLDSVAREDLDGAVVHLHGEMDGQLAFGLAQDLAQSRERLRRSAARSNWLLGDVPCVDRGSDLLGRHRPDTLHGRDRQSRDAAAPSRLAPAGWAALDDPDDVAAAFRLASESSAAGSTWAEYRPPAKPRHLPMSSARRLIGLTFPVV